MNLMFYISIRLFLYLVGLLYRLQAKNISNENRNAFDLYEKKKKIYAP